MTGKVGVFWDVLKYGFIRDPQYPNGGLFFHAKAVAPGSPIPEKGQLVSYDYGKFNGRPVAVNVRVIGVDDILGGGAE